MGRLEGSVSLAAKLTIAPEGEVEANLLVDHAVVSGKVVGDITARQSILLEPGSRVQGKVSAPKLVIAEGAEVSGQVEMSVELPEGLVLAAR